MYGKGEQICWPAQRLQNAQTETAPICKEFVLKGQNMIFMNCFGLFSVFHLCIARRHSIGMLIGVSGLS